MVNALKWSEPNVYSGDCLLDMSSDQMLLFSIGQFERTLEQ